MISPFDKKVGELRVWELYFGFVFLQVLIGIVITLLIGIFDIAGIRGALSQVVKQFAVILNAQSPQRYISPIAAELKEGNYI
jgi:hypothetical protein